MKEKRDLDNFIVGTLPTVIYIPDFITESEEKELLDNVYKSPISKWKSLKNRRLQNWGGVVHGKGLLPQESLDSLKRHFLTGLVYKRFLEYFGEGYNFLIVLGGVIPSMEVLQDFKRESENIKDRKSKINFLYLLVVPPWLRKITENISEESGLFPSAINHVLINEYLPNQGIMPHQDGPAYFPVVAILSLGSPVVMDFLPHSSLSSCISSSGGDGEGNDVNGTSSPKRDQSLNDHHPFSLMLMPRSLLIFKDDAYSKYLHGISDSPVHQYDRAVNAVEAQGLQPSPVSEKGIEEMGSGNGKCIERTETRISLTCRLVLKVHQKLFKF